MTKPTREQILAAHYATEQLALLATSITERQDVKDYREMILKALPPKPQPTMGDVEWDDDKHRFAEAEHVDWGTMIMLKPMREYPQIKCLSTKGGDFCILYPLAECITPTGRRYTPTEVQE